MDSLSDVLFGGLGGLTAAAAIFATFRQVIVRKLNQHYLRIEQLLASELAVSRKAAEFILENELPVYPVISELVYKAKAGAAQAVEATNVFNIIGADLRESCGELTTRLYGFRVFLPMELFDKLHIYKHLLQDLLVIGNTLTRQENLPPGMHVPDEAKTQIEILYAKIEPLCNDIQSDIRKQLIQLKGPINSTRP